MSKLHVIVLFSGGVDSSACLHYYKSRRFQVTPLFIDFGQKSAKQELKSARRIARYHKLKLQTLKVRGYKDLTKGLIMGRNLFLISSALMLKKNYRGLISLGIHAGTDYVDCSPSFVNQINDLLVLYKGGQIVLEAPFINMSKREITLYCIENNLPVELTYSCELGLNQPCGKCLSCKDLKSIYDLKKQHA